MAKRKKSSKKINWTDLAGVVAGAVIGKIVIAKLPVQNNLIKNGAPIALGAYLSTRDGDLIRGIGEGMVAMGAANLIGGIVPGISGLMTPALNGIDPLALDGVGAEDAPVSIEGMVYPEVSNDNRIAGGDEFIAGSEEFMA